MIAQVDEQEPAMIADAMDPAGKTHCLADVLRAEFSTGVRAIAMHAIADRELEGAAGKAHATVGLVKAAGKAAAARGTVPMTPRIVATSW
jgi:hypothetical protein